jgi:hypothetical protein
MDKVAYKNFTETDIDLINKSLKVYMQNQDKFKDYDFDGSAMSLLMNLFAYNTQYNAYYLNMMASEKFIKLAQKRKSVVELANNFNYIPQSSRSSTSYLTFDINVDEGFTDAVVIPKNVAFRTNVDGITYQFLTTSTNIIRYNLITNSYRVTNLEVKEGRFFTHKFLVTSQSQKFTIPNAGVDISRLIVKVKSTPELSDIYAREYKYYESILEVDSESLVYYIQETDKEKFEVYFGDGILGASVPVGSQVVLEYYVTSGSEPNGANKFYITDDVTGLNSTTLIQATKASNGYEIESIDSIRFSVKDNYKTQNRAVISRDYELKLKELIRDASDISIWGGETTTPKQYGKVFISVVKSNYQELSSIEELNIINKLKDNYMVMGITPQFSKINFLNLEIIAEARIKKDSNTTINDIIGNVNIAINMDIIPTLTKFNSRLYQSKVEETINYSDENIISSNVSTRVYYNLSNIILDRTQNSIQFPMALEAGSLTSSNFIYNGVVSTLVDDGLGFISMYQDGNLYIKNLMDINYVTGLIRIADPLLVFNLVLNNSINIYVKPASPDIIMDKNNILKITTNDIKVTLIND